MHDCLRGLGERKGVDWILWGEDRGEDLYRVRRASLIYKSDPFSCAYVRMSAK